MIESDTLAAVIEKQIKLAVDRSMESYVEKTITSLTLDPAWLSKRTWSSTDARALKRRSIPAVSAPRRPRDRLEDRAVESARCF